MSHHTSTSDAIRSLLQKDGERLGLGATGAYPEGVVNDLDEGEIKFGITSDRKRQKVFLNFGKAIDMVGMNPEQAIAVAQSLIKHARAVASLPVRVEI